MAIRGPFKRWRLVEPVRDLEDVTKIFRELEDAYEQMVYVLEQGSDDAPGTAPGDAEYILGVADVDLPNGRVLVSGQNTTADLGTPGQASIDVPNATTVTRGVVELALNNQSIGGLALQSNDDRLANARNPTGPAGGDLGGTYPNPIVDGVQGETFQSGVPNAGDLWSYAIGQWNHVPIGGDIAGAVGTTVVEAIRGNPVEAGAPTAGDVYRWDGSQFARWSPKYMTATLSVDQAANLAVNNHVEFDTVAETSGHITLSTGVGQANGIFTLPPGTWWIVASLSAEFSAAGGTLGVRLRNNTAASLLGGAAAFARPYTRTANDAAPILTHGIMTNTSTADLEARITISTSVTTIDSATSISIFALA